MQQIPTGAKRALHLVRSRDGFHYEHVSQLDVDQPTETTLRFLKDDTLVAMIRRTGKSPTGWIGLSEPPYETWTFHESNKRFGGPNFVQLPNETWLAGSRGYGENAARMELWWLDPNAHAFEELLTLPSGGDTSYPGFVIDEKRNRVRISYYSSHEGKASIYLATLRLNSLLSD